MKKNLALFAILGIAFAAPAQAAQIDFNFATIPPGLFGGPVTGSGMFTISNTPMTLLGQTAFAITAITGTVNGAAIIAPTGSYGAYYTTGPSFLDGSGANFVTAAGTSVSFFYEDAVSLYRVNTTGPFTTSFVTASATAVPSAPARVPEPASWLILLAGLSAMSAVAYFGRKDNASLPA